MSDDIYRAQNSQIRRGGPSQDVFTPSHMLKSAPALGSASANVSRPPAANINRSYETAPTALAYGQHGQFAKDGWTHYSTQRSHVSSRPPVLSSSFQSQYTTQPSESWQSTVPSAPSGSQPEPSGHSRQRGQNVPRSMQAGFSGGGMSGQQEQHPFNYRQAEARPERHGDAYGRPTSQGVACLSIETSMATMSLERSTVQSPGAGHSRQPSFNRGQQQRRATLALGPRSTPGPNADPSPRHTRQLQEGYKQQRYPRKYFIVGRVFHMVWSEPGQHDADNASSSWTINSYGQWIYTKPRRFIVVRVLPQACLVVPITSYGSQGVGKQNVKKSDHCIAYTGRMAPEPMASETPVPTEQGMQPYAIRINPDDREDKLDEMSRIDFSCPRKVDHYNVVKNFGKVHPDSMHALVVQFQNVMDPSRARQVLPSAQPIAILSASSKHRDAFHALINFGWTMQQAADYVNLNVRASRTNRTSAEPDSSGSEDGDDRAQSDGTA